MPVCFKKGYFLILLSFLTLLLTSCGAPKVGSKKEIYTQQKLKKLLKQAEKDFKEGYYDIAYKTYKKIRDWYPGTQEAVLAELKMADCKFWEGNYLEAIPIYQEFEKFYPDNKAIPYVIYQIGTCYYKLRLPYDRDQTFTKKAIEAYQRLLQDFPGNPYRIEIKKRIHILRELLAEHEFYVAKFYYKMKYYRAAYGRILYILNNYPDTKVFQKAKKLVLTYYKKALLETKELREGKKKDFWGEPVP